ncbi:hypothetical protein L198_05873 [Cryptococcus wingfieldii CBS 7118]|uniref:Uncharacterized protein n=1 Tax=Cryptococcus wingfieldii CBS 7118 TaxID=1295528 RepID=A0A1E3IS15_9TREE|nr:hypothetical protein L198_05873 [Cryptococcus wingfieldii CBS 7118]ODN91362.1 hypothetical protein L198_05873 [Cryptococcus wingfieldii CBS 7118]
MSIDNNQPTYVQSTATMDCSTISTHATRITNTFMTSLDDDLASNQYREKEGAILSQSRDSIKQDLSHAVSAVLEFEIDTRKREGETVGSMDNVAFTPSVIVPATGAGVQMSGYLSGDGWSGSSTVFKVPLAPLK